MKKAEQHLFPACETYVNCPHCGVVRLVGIYNVAGHITTCDACHMKYKLGELE